MKKFKTIILLYLCFLCGIGAFTACSDDNSEPNGGGEIPVITDQDLSDIVVEDSGSVSWHDHYSNILKEAQQGNSEEDSLLAVIAKRNLEVADSLTDAYIDSIGGNGNLPGTDDGKWNKDGAIGYRYVSLRYKTVDKDGKPIECSELVVGPYNKILPDPHPDNIVIGCHVTITSNHERPSKYESLTSDVGMLATHANTYFSCSLLPHMSIITNSITYGGENLVIIPDYQGYGATHGDAHPYLSQDLTARQVVDGVIAGKKWFEKYGKTLEKKYKTVAIGYSQGGSVAMAVHRYIETHNLTKTLNFAGSVCGDGPYDPVATLKKYIDDDKVYMPVAAGLIIKGMCDANPYVAGKYSPSDYFTDKFIQSGILNWIASKNFTTTEIQEMLLNYSMNNLNGFVMMRKSGNTYLPYISENVYISDGNKRAWEEASEDASCYCTVDQLLRPEVIEYFKNGGLVETQYMDKMTAIQNALEMNNLTKGWTPQHPMFVFHAEKDEVVPFVNYESASAAFPGRYFKGLKYTKNGGTHVNTGTTFYVWKENSYFKSIISDKWQKSYPDHDKIDN